MDYSVEKQKGAVKIDFKITAAQWNDELSGAYSRTRGKYNIPGFRKGHAPRGVIESMYGKGVFFDEAFESVFRSSYSEVLEKETWIFPVDDPKVDLGEMDDKKFTFSATITVKPEIKLGSYKGMEIPKEQVKVTKEEVDHMVEHAREHASRFVDVTDRAVQDGDIVTLDYSGSVGGVKFDGGTAQNQELTIGSHSFIPGFEEQLVGVKIGESKDLHVKFPDDYHAENLKGKDAVFAVTVHAIKVKEMPELNDEFAKDVSSFDTLADYKADIEKRLTEDKQHHADVDSENAMLKMIADGVDADIPQCMIDTEVDYMLADFEMQLSRAYGGMKLADYFKYTGLKEIDFRRQRRESAISNVKTRLALEKIIESEGLQVSDEEVDAELNKSGKSENISAEADARRRSYIKSDLLMAKVVDFLKANNKFVPKKESAEKTEEKKPAAKKSTAAKKPSAKSAAGADKKTEGKAE
ncbi:MAG: trigger factor [Clostridia bacterium]|nr:trigger factor [Clostridia bacterium]